MLYFVMIARTGGIIMSVTIREPGSAITHFIGMMMAIIASTPPVSYTHLTLPTIRRV